MDGALLGILKKSMNSGIGSSSVTALDTKIDNLSNKIGTQNNQVFTSSGTFNVPSGVTKIYVTACAGGGGGAGGGKYASSTNITAYSGAGGNGGEFVYRYPITVTPGSSISITVGSGGSGGSGNKYDAANAGGAGGTGGNTIIGSYLTLTGGASGGTYGTGGIPVINGGYGGGGNGTATYNSGSVSTSPGTPKKSKADINYVSGIPGWYINRGGTGGSLTYGGLGGGSLSANYGMGGNGGACSSTTSSSSSYPGGSNGSAGKPGICIIEWGNIRS